MEIESNFQLFSIPDRETFTYNSVDRSENLVGFYISFNRIVS